MAKNQLYFSLKKYQTKGEKQIKPKKEGLSAHAKLVQQ
jgi:hypothetical protein